MKNLYEDIGGKGSQSDQEFVDRWHDFTEILLDEERRPLAKNALNQARIAAEAIADEKMRLDALDQIKEGEVALKQK